MESMPHAVRISFIALFRRWTSLRYSGRFQTCFLQVLSLLQSISASLITLMELSAITQQRDGRHTVKLSGFSLPGLVITHPSPSSGFSSFCLSPTRLTYFLTSVTEQAQLQLVASFSLSKH
jgi:hypothetical protein